MDASNTPSAHACTPDAKQSARQQYQQELLNRYSQEQQDALLRLFSLPLHHPGTSGGNTAAKLLIGLYNGLRFPFDLTDLRLLDGNHLNAAMVVIDMDARRTHAEVHEVLNAILGVTWAGHQLEVWAYEMRLPKRCKKEAVPELRALIAGAE